MVRLSSELVKFIGKANKAKFLTKYDNEVLTEATEIIQDYEDGV